MTEPGMRTKADLLAETERAWIALNALLGSLTGEQMTTLKDHAGWSVKDHIIHMVYWERTVLYFLQGKPRHEGLGVDEALFMSGDFDKMNAVVQQQHKDEPLADVLAQFRSTHHEMLTLLESLSDADLQKPFRRWRPGEAGEGEGPKLIDLLDGNMGGHFAEHLEWLQTLVGKTV